ncbi:universal stress protein [Rhodoferax saidenbachensis]|uniref:UspA domain-containing protein n=1 Tax=Rhodoferax saidenbachensis TaxID=1484693 RepID=A0A1P8K9R3_9BURK|nr:universal stress protein [Rhodoferax saidenbachensis]APW42722.1 hypothetical protein RS694_09370 [Rhodoferax saidenbachensis]
MNIQFILAVTDFSTAAEHGLERAALIAASHRARLRIIYGAEVPNLGLSDPSARLRQRGRQLARRHGITVEAIEHTPHMLDDVVRLARGANLLVMDPRRHRALHTFWRGTTLDQLLRRVQCPMLIVKNAPSGRYQRMLVAVDFTLESGNLVRYASGLEADSALELFHALDARCSTGRPQDMAPEDAMAYYRKLGRQDAQGRPLRFSESLDTRRNRVSSITGRSAPAREIAVQQCFAAADLVIVGEKRNATLVDFLFGSMARQLIPLASSDVLVFPHAYQAPSGAIAKERIRTVLNGVRLT